MVSFPRDMSRLPTPGGKPYMGKINSLMTYADKHPKEYPEGGMAALAKEVGYLLGAPVDYYASVDLEGFRKLIDRVGGVTVNVQTAINDPGYGGWDTPGKIGFKISTGKHTLDGETALAFVRIAQEPRRQRLRARRVASSSSSSRSSASWSTRRCCRTSRAAPGRDQDAQDELPARPHRRGPRSRPQDRREGDQEDTSSGRPTRTTRRT